MVDDVNGGTRATPRRASVSAGTAIALSVAMIGVGIGIGAAIWGGESTRQEPNSPSSAETEPSCARPNFISDGFPQPPVRHSTNRVLDTTLRASDSPVTINGQQITAMNYEGTVPGPTLVVCRGDKLKVHLRNDLPASVDPTKPMEAATNLHTHGFHVTPTEPSDNVLHHVMPGQTYDYEYDLSKNDAGLHWYHPHSHEAVNSQLGQGMLGGIVELGDLDDVQGVRGLPERLMIIQSVKIVAAETVDPGDAGDTQELPAPGASPAPGAGLSAADSAPTAAQFQLVVNQVAVPDIKIRPGELQRWRILNGITNRVLKIGLQGQDFPVIADDANTLTAPRIEPTMLIGPGSRREVLIRGGAEGTYKLSALDLANATEEPLATVTSAGEPVTPAPPLPTLLLPHEDLRGQTIARHRDIRFAETRMVGQVLEEGFFINGMTFDERRIDHTMQLGTIEEWTLWNDDKEAYHTFHIHQNPFQVVNRSGVKVAAIEFEDNVVLPPGHNVTILQRFADFTGPFVFHCHFAFHEDNGMMSRVEVVP